MQRGKVMGLTVAVVAIVMVLVSLINTQYAFQSQLEYQNTYYGLSLILVFLFSLKEKKDGPWLLSLLLIVLSLVATGYVKIFRYDLQFRAGLNTGPDLIIGALLILVGFEASRRCFGYILPVIAGICVLYTLFGHYLAGPLWHYPVTLSQAISRYSIGLTGGIYGTILYVFANYIFLFIVFGSLLMASGATDFFMELGKLAGRKLAGGPAMTAVVSSALVGTVTGSAVSNVVITGSFTIPLMKKMGYRPAMAGAIEAAASTGGHIMPPVMAGVAFLMAAMVGISYVQVMTIAIIPAILYFLSVGLFVHLSANRLGIKTSREQIDTRTIRRGAPQFIIPLGVLLVLLLSQYSPMFAAFWAIVSILAVSLVRKETRQSFRVWLDGIVRGAQQGAQIGAMAAVIGAIMSSFTITGLGMKIPSMIEVWSGGYLIAALAMAAAATVILGTAVPMMAAYLIVALLVAPALVNTWGIPVIHVHFFIMFFASFSTITPPVATAALVASKIAEASYLRTSVESVKAAIAAFILPFLFLWAPVLLLQPAATESIPLMVMKLLSCLMAIVSLQVTTCGFYLAATSKIERPLAGLVAILFLASVLVENYAIFAIASSLFAVLTFQQFRRRRLTRVAAAASASL